MEEKEKAPWSISHGLLNALIDQDLVTVEVDGRLADADFALHFPPELVTVRAGARVLYVTDYDPAQEVWSLWPELMS